MAALGIAVKNAAAAVGIGAFLVISHVLTLPAYLKEARLSCSASGLNMQFDSMRSCANSPDLRPGCGCSPLRNPWSLAYQWGLVPLLAGFIGLVALRGTTRIRLAVLNGTIVLVLVGAVIVGIGKDGNTAMVIPFIPVIAAVACGMITGWYWLLGFGYKIWKGRKHAT